MKKKEKPILFFSRKREDLDACLLVMKSGIDCEFLFSDDDDTPKLVDGYQKFKGIKRIKKYLEGIKKGEK